MKCTVEKDEELLKEKKNHEIEKTIEIKKEELQVSKQHKLILKK